MKLKNVVLEERDRIVSVKEIIHEPKPCEDCGAVVTDRHVEYRHNHSSVTIPHFKIECRSCRRFRNPETGAFDMDRKEIDNYYRRTNHRKK